MNARKNERGEHGSQANGRFDETETTGCKNKDTEGRESFNE